MMHHDDERDETEQEESAFDYLSRNSDSLYRFLNEELARYEAYRRNTWRGRLSIALSRRFPGLPLRWGQAILASLVLGLAVFAVARRPDPAPLATSSAVDLERLVEVHTLVNSGAGADAIRRALAAWPLAEIAGDPGSDVDLCLILIDAVVAARASDQRWFLEQLTETHAKGDVVRYATKQLAAWGAETPPEPSHG